MFDSKKIFIINLTIKIFTPHVLNAQKLKNGEIKDPFSDVTVLQGCPE